MTAVNRRRIRRAKKFCLVNQSMTLLTTTPFGQRPVTAGLVDRARAAQAQATIPHINKWQIFRELCAARAAFGVTDRDLTVLNALLSFHRGDTLSDNDSLIVYPSNAALSDRAHGMAESTLRRHLAALGRAGLIQRHDSPNGKRYATRGIDGEPGRAFGFDLRPLLVQGSDILQAANSARAAADQLKRLREQVVLLKRDAIKLAAYGQQEHPHSGWDALQHRLLTVHKQMRRKLPQEALETLKTALGAILVDIQRILTVRAIPETIETSGNDGDYGRHYQISNSDSLESELCQETGEGGKADPLSDPPALADPPDPANQTKHVRLPLALVLKAAPDILPYAQDDIRHWHQLVAAAGFVRGMMGISPDAWTQAQLAMGAENAAITLVCILQRVTEINSPGGYLRALTAKADLGTFSPGPMVMALLNGDAKAA